MSASPSRGRYSDPQLRERIRRRVLAGGKGGKPGQWSARKAQLVASEYKRAGGGYRGGKAATQRHLDAWTAEDWHTRDGGTARRAGGTARYLPDAAWRALTPDEARATDRRKRRGSRAGRQFVGNTAKAAAAGRRARTATRGRGDSRSRAAAERSAGHRSRAAPTKDSKGRGSRAVPKRSSAAGRRPRPASRR